MTTTDPHTLGRRWLAAGGPWLEGMCDIDGWRCWCFGSGDSPVFVGGDEDGLDPERLAVPDQVPDLHDPATLGAAIGHLRRVYDAPGLVCAPYRRIELGLGWSVYHQIDDGQIRIEEVGRGATEAEAIVAALEAHRG